MLDFALTGYILYAVLLTGATYLFVSWWWRYKKALQEQPSEVYRLVSFYFFFEAINKWIEVYARYLYINDPIKNIDFLQTPLWGFRSFPCIIVLGMLIMLLACRWYQSWKAGGEVPAEIPKRRSTDV